MSRQLVLDYIYGDQALEFSFVKVPKLLLMDKTFKNISLESKMLYGVLMDKMKLASSNDWYDEIDRVYVICPLTEIMELFQITKKKAIALLSELENNVLIAREKQGNGLPNRIYVIKIEAAKMHLQERSAGNGTSVR